MIVVKQEISAAHCLCAQLQGSSCAGMKRSDLEHILRASKGITGETEFIVIGSQLRTGRRVADRSGRLCGS